MSNMNDPFDLYPGIDDELQAALERNAEQGNATPETIGAVGMAAAIREAIKSPAPEISEKVKTWADAELETARSKWHLYSDFFASPYIELMGVESGPNYAATLTRLHKAKETLDISKGMTFNSEPIGEVMLPVLVPWQFFRGSLDNLPEAVKQFRRRQGVRNYDIGLTGFMSNLTSMQIMYRSWDEPDVTYSLREYLDRKIEQDGPWGIMLAQTSDLPGVKGWGWSDKSLNSLTDGGKRPIKVNGQPVADMGIFEWLAFTLQENPADLSISMGSILPANSLRLSGTTTDDVPYGFWTGSGFELETISVNKGDNMLYPRLAVL